MNAIAMNFDTLKCAKRLQAAGFTEKQAEAQAQIWGETVLDNLATKEDIKRLEEKINEMDDKFDHKINFLEASLSAKTEQQGKDIRHELTTLETGLRADMKEMETGIRADMKEMETGIRADMREMETGIRADMKLLESRVLSRLGGLMVICLGLFFTFQTIILKLH